MGKIYETGRSLLDTGCFASVHYFTLILYNSQTSLRERIGIYFAKELS
jgi:hypothetical protein